MRGRVAEDRDLTVSSTTLADMLRSGDVDAIAGFRDAHAQRVRRYCLVVCRPDRVQEACDAAFVDFLARVQLEPRTENDLKQMLLKATRAAAAGRFAVQPVEREPAEEHRPASAGSTCLAIPELLAARANGELVRDPARLDQHMDRCATCAASLERMALAEQRYEDGEGWDSPEPEEPEPEPTGAADRTAPVPSPPPAPKVVRVRRGGIVGAARRKLHRDG